MEPPTLSCSEVWCRWACWWRKASRWSRRGDNGLSSPKTDILSLPANSFWLVLSTTDTRAHADTPTRTLVPGRMKEAEREARRRDGRAKGARDGSSLGVTWTEKRWRGREVGDAGEGGAKVQVTKLITASPPEKYERRIFTVTRIEKSRSQSLEAQNPSCLKSGVSDDMGHHVMYRCWPTGFYQVQSQHSHLCHYLSLSSWRCWFAAFHSAKTTRNWFTDHRSLHLIGQRTRLT